jgi:signal transduction histidine kinase
MMAQETTDLPIQFSKIGDERRLKPEFELGLYRIAQEVLSNILRHAKARSAEIKLNYLPNSISMEICDDGVGFTPPRSPAEFAPAGHYGLLGIYERVEGIGGKLSIETETNKGSTIRVTLQA